MPIGRNVFAVVLCAGLMADASRAKAAYSDNFDDLRAELVSRASVLTNSLDKTKQKQGKVCVKAIATLDKSTQSLGTDIKAGGKVAKTLSKTFTNDFQTAQLALVVIDLQTLLNDALTGIADNIQTALDLLQTSINSLPAGNSKTSAQAALDAAQTALTSVLTAPDIQSAVKLLSTAFKELTKGQSIVTKAGGGGGGGGSCGTITTSTVMMTVQTVPWSATMNFPTSFAGGEYLVSTGFFNVGGTAADGSALGITVNTGVTTNVPNTYAISVGVNSTYTIGSPPTQTFNITSGTVTINGLDTTAWTTCGTASFTATDGTTTITVTDLEFSVKDLGHE